jgi:hypothetical protein
MEKVVEQDKTADVPATPMPWPFPVWDGSRFACLEAPARAPRITARAKLADLINELGDAP